MADDDETIVVIDDKQQAIPDAGDQVVPADAAVAELKAQYEALQAETTRERERAAQAERTAQAERQARQKAESEVVTARTEIADSHLDTVTSGLSAAQTEAEAASAEWQAAMEAGDWAKAKVAQRKVANAEAKIVRLDEAKADLEARKAAPAQREPMRAESRIEVNDPVEAFIQGRSEPTAKWLREHKEWITDARKNAKLTAAHHDAVAEGLNPDTPEYFSHVEKFIGLKKADTPNNGAGRPQPPRRQSVPVAPVNQTSANGVNGREVRLSKREAEAATDGTHVWNYDDPSPQKRFRKGEPIGIQEFARRKAAMQAQGLYDKSVME